MSQQDTPTLLIESQYFGNIQYFARLVYHQKLCIERWEHWVKSTFRNRTVIANPEGANTLSVPLEKGKGQRRIIKSVKIDTKENWRKSHWDALQYNYRSTPFFEYYEDDLYPIIFEGKQTYLYDLNMDLLNFVLEQLNESIDISFTKQFEKTYDPTKKLDFRSAIVPQVHRCKPDELFKAPKYHQLFEDKHGFIPNLSILDLLFAEGTNCGTILRASMRKQPDIEL